MWYLIIFLCSSTNGLTAAEVLEELASKTIKTSVSRFNINRANVWDGAARGFRRVSYNPTDDILVKFSDDAGQREDGMDNGGPKREFLTLLMKCLRSRRIFDGPEDSKFLTFDSAGEKFIPSDYKIKLIHSEVKLGWLIFY